MENESIYDGDYERVYVRLTMDETVYTGHLIAVTEVVLVMHRDNYPDNLLTYYPLRSVRQFDVEVDPDDLT